MAYVRVEARIHGSVAYRWDGMHLDGILSAGHYMTLSDADKLRLPHVDEEPVDFDLPLIRRRYGDDWVWAASAVHVGEFREHQYPLRTRPPEDLYARRSTKPSLELGSGRFKAHDKTVDCLSVDRLVWYAIGDAAEVRKLLARVPGIGRCQSIGLGYVSEWVVDEVRSVDIVRRLPYTPDTANLGVIGYGAIRPPYHTRVETRLRQCVEPIYRELRA
jgi:CRISPR type IV-associated protein Csf3